DLAGELVAEHVTVPAAVGGVLGHVQVAAADSAAADLDHDLAGVRFRVGKGLERKRTVQLLEGDRLHSAPMTSTGLTTRPLSPASIASLICPNGKVSINRSNGKRPARWCSISSHRKGPTSLSPPRMPMTVRPPPMNAASLKVRLSAGLEAPTIPQIPLGASRSQACSITEFIPVVSNA